MTMRRVVLLYNPQAGRGEATRSRRIATLAARLREHGCEVQAVATTSPGSAIEQTRALCSSNPPEIVFACGGDGTAHEVLQGLAFCERTALGIIPLGSANVLAKHLRLPRDPITAALEQLARAPRRVHAGRVTCTTAKGSASRYFLVVAGAGPDGALVYRALAHGKRRFGGLHYALRSAWLFCTAHFSAFQLTANGTTQPVISAMAVRVHDLGSIYTPLIRGAHHDDETLLLSVVRAPAKPALVAWFALGWVRLHRLNRWAALQRATHATCSAGLTAPVRVEADGESLGTTPMTLEVVPDAVWLLPPQ